MTYNQTKIRFRWRKFRNYVSRSVRGVSIIMKLDRCPMIKDLLSTWKDCWCCPAVWPLSLWCHSLMRDGLKSVDSCLREHSRGSPNSPLRATLNWTSHCSLFGVVAPSVALVYCQTVSCEEGDFYLMGESCQPVGLHITPYRQCRAFPLQINNAC